MIYYNNQFSKNISRKRFLYMAAALLLAGIIVFNGVKFIDEPVEYLNILSFRLKKEATKNPDKFKIPVADGEPIENLCECSWGEVMYVNRRHSTDPFIYITLISGVTKRVSNSQILQEIKKKSNSKKSKITQKDIESLFGGYAECCIFKFRKNEEGTYFYNVAYMLGDIDKKEYDNTRNGYRKFEVVDVKKNGKIRKKVFRLISEAAISAIKDILKNKEAAIYQTQQAISENGSTLDLNKNPVLNRKRQNVENIISKNIPIE